jgi:hypothetical protein
VLRLVFAGVFENELYGWHTVESDWPQNRTLETFRQWFRIEFHTIVEDLVDGPLLDDEIYD